MRIPLVEHTPTAASITMTDLRAELERRHSGEEGNTTIER
jgi:chorismate synthase